MGDSLSFESQILRGIESGDLDGADIIVVVAALRRWEEDGLWAVV
jgi:hypothetical protein